MEVCVPWLGCLAVQVICPSQEVGAAYMVELAWQQKSQCPFKIFHFSLFSPFHLLFCSSFRRQSSICQCRVIDDTTLVLMWHDTSVPHRILEGL